MAHLTGSASLPVDLMTVDRLSDYDYRCGNRSDCMDQSGRERETSLNILKFIEDNTATVVAGTEVVYGFTCT